MLKKIILASKNNGKRKEIFEILNSVVGEIESLPKDYKDVLENGVCFEENALIKAKASYDTFNEVSLADDSGLVVNALNGPGIHSARYGGNISDGEKCVLILENMKGVADRSAYFVCVFALVLNENIHAIFEGRVYGKISEKIEGAGGFGYDPIFIPNGYEKTFAQMPIEKNTMSHRANAAIKLKTFLSHMRLNN